ASLFFVFLKIDRLIPATKLAVSLGEPAAVGMATTPYSLDFMPSACSVLSALFWLISIAALPLAKSPGASGPFLYCTELGLTTWLAPIRSTYCLTPATWPGLVK